MRKTTPSPTATARDKNLSVDEGLQCLIVGGSIAGLAAALALRAQGHHVNIYEQNMLNSRNGAGLAVFPNTIKALEYLNVELANIRPVKVEKVVRSTVDSTGKMISESENPSQEWAWMNTLYPDIFTALYEAALDAKRPGPAVIFHTMMEVRAVDPLNAVIYFTDNTEARGDLVIGADGVHSVCRTSLSGARSAKFRLDRTAFRATVTRQALMHDPRTSDLVESPGLVHHYFGNDQGFYVHPASNGQIMSVRCTYTNDEASSEALSRDWRDRPSKSKMLRVTEGLPLVYRQLLEKVDPDSIQHVPIWDMDPLPAWNSYRFAVVGDAAHAMPPYWGQRTAMALEDAMALGIIFEKGTAAKDVKDRFELYTQIRKNRVVAVQDCVRKLGESVGGSCYHSASSFQQNYILDHDERESMTTAFGEWKAQRSAGTSPEEYAVVHSSKDEKVEQESKSQAERGFWPKFSRCLVM